MELLQLRYFYESAKNENFAKTAQKYMVPTSSVSASVKRLETELGCNLFERESNRIAINSNGKRLRQALCVAFDEIDAAVDDITSPIQDTREIRLLVRAMRKKITDYIIEYSEKHPCVAFRTVFDFTDTDLDKYDIIIDEKTNAYPEYKSFELFSMRLRMRAAESSPLRKRKLTMKQLRNQPFISMGEQSNMHRILMEACGRAGFSPNIAVMSNDIVCYEKMIESGIGIGIGRESDHRTDGVYLDIADFDEKYTVYSYYKENSAYGNVKHFLDFLKSKSE